MSKKDNQQKGLEEGLVKKIVMGVTVGAVVIAVLITFIFNRGGVNEANDLNPEELPEEEIQIEDDREKLLEDVEASEGDENVEDLSAEDKAKKNKEKAKSELERADESLEEELTEDEMSVLTADLQKLFDYLEKDRSDFEGEYFVSEEYRNSIAGQTEPYMANQINVAMNLAGYQMDPASAEWFPSDTEEVYQFAVSMKADGREELVFSGNYNRDKQFFKIFQMNGQLDMNEFASPGDEAQDAETE